MKVYKVTNHNNESVIAEGDLNIYYPIDQWVKTSIGKIFCFKSFKAAKLFAGGKQKIWLVEAKNISECPKRVPYSQMFYADFWLKKSVPDTALGLSQPGAILADEIKLIIEEKL